MATFRVYLNLKPRKDHEGGEHSRFVDVEAGTPDLARAQAEPKKTEQIGDVVELAPVQEMPGP